MRAEWREVDSKDPLMYFSFLSFHTLASYVSFWDEEENEAGSKDHYIYSYILLFIYLFRMKRRVKLEVRTKRAWG